MKAREDAEKIQKIKGDKIESLQQRIAQEQRNQEEVVSKVQNSKMAKDQSQAMKLKNAYERMLAFERERLEDKKAKNIRKHITSARKNRQLAQNYQLAETIRQEERNLKQARYFNNELKKMNR